MPMKTPFELEIVNDNDDNDNGDKVCVFLPISSRYLNIMIWLIMPDSRIYFVMEIKKIAFFICISHNLIVPLSPKIYY